MENEELGICLRGVKLAAWSRCAVSSTVVLVGTRENKSRTVSRVLFHGLLSTTESATLTPSY